MIPKWEKPHREKWCDQACLRNSILRRWDLANAKSARRSESGFELGYLVHSRTTLNSKFRSDSEYKPDLSGEDKQSFLKSDVMCSRLKSALRMGSHREVIFFENNFRTWEFDPGSGWTLAACLTHASRTKHSIRFLSGMTILWLSGGRVSNAWVTCLIQGDNSWKRLLIPHKRTVPHGTVWKTPVVWDGPASD